MIRCLYFSYDGLLDPLGQSQVVPYIERLVAAGHSFTVISYEKGDRSPTEVSALERRLSKSGVDWLQLPFRSGKLAIVKRIADGITAIRKACRQKNLNLVHLRGFTAAVIYKLSLTNVPHLYDFRGFALGEWTDIGKIREGSLAHKVLRKIDHTAVETACGLVVLEQPAEALLRNTYNVPRVPLKVIRTCTDVASYCQRNESATNVQLSPIKFVWLGGARRPYRPDLAMRFVLQLWKAGIDCEVGFLNERDHAEIVSAAEDVGFPRDKMTLLRLNQQEIPGALQKYDCGLVFLDTSPWRRVCSPTKVGEYLAAGLPVISLDGIDVLEQFAANTPCVEIVSKGELSRGLLPETVSRLVALIRGPGVGAACQELARRECSLEMAGRLYVELYAEIEAEL